MERLIDPLSLVREYVKRDAAGERLTESPWFQAVVSWPFEPGYDSYTVIRAYTVEKPAHIAGSPARITVRYDVVGWMVHDGQQMAFLEQELEEALEFVVERTEAGWRIAAPQMGQRVLAEIVAADSDLPPEDAARLREMAAPAPAPP
jgi:hypothetical protein